MITNHDCWWTRHHQTELTDTGDTLMGAGCPREVLEHLAGVLGADLHGRPSDTDEYGEEIALGSMASGSSHDGCFFALSPSSTSLKRAVVASVLDLHATYLDRQVDWSGVLDGVAARLIPGVSLRMRARPRERRLTIQCYPRTGGFLRRLLAQRLIVECGGRRGRAFMASIGRHPSHQG